MKLNSIGKYVRKSRIAKGFRQEDLAEMIDLSSVYVGMLERGEKVASLETLVKIANALDVSSDYLLCEVLNNGYKVKDSMLNEKLDSVCDEDRIKIYDVIDTMISHSKKKLKQNYAPYFLYGAFIYVKKFMSFIFQQKTTI